MKQARWLVLAAVLLGLGAWLMTGKPEGARKKPPPVAFPVGPRASEHQRMDARRTLNLPAPSATSALEPPPPAGPRDPMLMAIAVPADVAVIAEAQALLNAPVVQMFFDCLGDTERKNFERDMTDKGVDWRKVIDRFGMLKEQGQQGEVALLQGKFGDVDWDKVFPGAEVTKLGPDTRMIHRPGSHEKIGLFRGEMMLAGPEEQVTRALKRLTGELPPAPKPPLQDSEAYGEIYGVLGHEAIAAMAPPELREKMAKTLSKVEIHVDASDDVLLVLDGTGEDDPHGHAAHELVDLAKSMAAGLAVARVKAKADKEDLLVDLLDQSRVRPFMGGLRAEVAIPLETVKKHLGNCKKE